MGESRKMGRPALPPGRKRVPGFSVRLRPAELEWARRLSAATGRSFSELAWEGLVLLARKRRHPEPPPGP